MSRPLAAARLLIIAALLTGSPAGAAPASAVASAGAPALRSFALVSRRVQAAAAPSSDATTVLDINGSGAIRLRNQFLAGGLLLYIAVMVAALVFLEKRRVAATAILAAGLIVGGLLLARAFG